MNNDKLISAVGILLTSIFIGGFLIFFWFNPKAFEELNNLSLFAYNLKGMNGRMWAIFVIYLTVGLLNMMFSIGLFIVIENKSIIVVGKILLLIAGTLWLTFGLFPYDVQTVTSVHLFLIRVIAVILSSALALIILGAEFEKIHQSKFLKLYTLSSGLFIMLLGFMSAFVYNDTTWVRTNVSLGIYFLWFGVFGVLFLLNRNPNLK